LYYIVVVHVVELNLFSADETQMTVTVTHHVLFVLQTVIKFQSSSDHKRIYACLHDVIMTSSVTLHLQFVKTP